MKIVYGDLFSYSEGNILGVPTNGYLTDKGLGVMGAGVALEVKKRWSEAPKWLGLLLSREGNHVGWIMTYPQKILALPVKPSSLLYNDERDLINVLPFVRKNYKKGQVIPGYHCFADITLIERTLQELKQFIISNDISKNLFMPMLGCGKGGLIYDEVFPIIKNSNLPDNVILVL